MKQMMNKYSKSISEEQTDKLLAHSSSDNPLCFIVFTSVLQGIVKQMMNKYSESISEEQTDKLLAHSSSDNPHWLIVTGYSEPNDEQIQ